MINPQFSQFMSNPRQFLMSHRFNVPPNVIDPQSMVQHLMNSGQMSQDTYNRLDAVRKQIEGQMKR